MKDRRGKQVVLLLLLLLLMLLLLVECVRRCQMGNDKWRAAAGRGGDDGEGSREQATARGARARRRGARSVWVAGLARACTSNASGVARARACIERRHSCCCCAPASYSHRAQSTEHTRASDQDTEQGLGCDSGPISDIGLDIARARAVCVVRAASKQASRASQDDKRARQWLVRSRTLVAYLVGFARAREFVCVAVQVQVREEVVETARNG